MTENKKSVKKLAKNVLDYDPLAWLGEGDDEENTEKVKQSAKPKKPDSKKKIAKTSVPKNKSAKKSAKKSQTKKAVANKTVSKKTPDTPEEATIMNNSNEENLGYGFFDDVAEPDEIKTTQVATVEDTNTGTEDEQGFGFFEPLEQLTSQSVELDSSTNVINLGAELTIRSVSACKAFIDDNLSNGFDIKLAAGELQKIDTAGLQLIYSLNNTLEKTAQSINWVSSNSIINEAAQLIGMPKLLEAEEDDGAFGFFDEDIKTDKQNSQQDDSAFGFF